MFKSENTTYVIRYDYSLNGDAISLPKNSTLEFDGGSIVDGKIEGRNTRIINSTSNSFINIETTGTWNTELSEPIEGEIKTINVVRDIIANQDSITNIENNIDNIEEDIKDIDKDLSGLHEDFNKLPKVDEEDITVGEDNSIRFKDKEYSEKDYSGLGRVYLRKNIIANRNILTQEMVNKPNTIYIIQYDYDLNQKEITIPEGCILDFQGGSLSNGTISGNYTKLNLQDYCIINTVMDGYYDINYLSFKYFSDYTDDTKLIRAMFNILFKNKSECILDLESNRVYNIYSPRLSTSYSSIFQYENVNNKIINGNNANINDLRTRTEMGASHYDGFLRLSKSSNIQILNLNYQNLNEDYDLPTQIGYIGTSFVILHLDCSNINITSNIIGARYGIKSGSYNKYWLSGKYGIKDCSFNINAYKCGYPVAIEVGQNLNININSEIHHRAAYLCGISNSSIYIEAKDNYIAPLHCLLSDGRYSDEQNNPKFKSCYDINVVVKDKGTSNESSSKDRYLCGFQTYSTFTERTTPLLWNNINISCIKEVESNFIGLFSFERGNDNIPPNNIPDVYNNIHIKGIDLNNSTSYAARITGSSYAIYNNVDFEIIAPQQRLIWDNASKGELILQNSEIRTANVAGNIKVDKCKIENWEKFSSNIGVNWYEAVVSNSDVHITNSVVDKLDVDFSSLRHSSVSIMPKGLNKKSIVYDNVLRYPKIWDGARWIDCSGVFLEAKKSGTFAEKPVDYMNIYIGYSYFCTNKQTAEGATNGIVIYYKGDNVWVDALGRVVDNNYPLKVAGTTEERPVLLENNKGYQYFDTTINKSIWWTGSTWVDTTGTSV